MAINTLATETLFQRTLDKLAVQEAVTGWMDANAGQVIYSGGKEVKIPKLSVQDSQTMTVTTGMLWVVLLWHTKHSQ